MSFYSPEARRITFDYEISSGKTALRIFKHEKDFERLYWIPSKDIEELMYWRLTVKPEVSENIFGVNGNGPLNINLSTGDSESSKRKTLSETPAFQFKPIEKLPNTFSLSPNKPSTPVVSLSPTNTKIAVQVSLLNVSSSLSSLKETGLKTTIKVVFRDKSSIIILSKWGNYTFTNTDRSFDLSMAATEFNNFEKEIIVNVEITILEMEQSSFKNVYIRNLSNDLSNLYETKKFTDTTLVVDDGEFNVHRGILAARSTVFAAMFERTMKEGISGTAIIEDLDKDVLNELLYFIYTGRVKNLKEYGPGLLVASDKYDIPNLKEICEDFLSNNLTLEVACEELILADIHSCQNLKPKATKFLVDNALEITKTTGWKNMIKSHPYLVAEMFEAMAIKSDSTNKEAESGK